MILQTGSEQSSPMAGPHIIFVNRFFAPDHSATSQILSDLAFHLARKGKDVAVITSRGLYDDPSAELSPIEEIEGVTVHRVCKPRFGRGSLYGRAIDYVAMYRAFAAAALRLSAPGDCLVAKTDPPLLSVVLAPVARAKGVHLINWLQDLYPEVALGLGLRALAPVAPMLIAARNASLKAAVRNVVIGERMRLRLEALAINKTQIEIIPNWCDDRLITPQPAETNSLRADWGLKEKFVIGYCGNLGRAHECDTILDAAERLRAEPDITFLFVGGGRLAATLRSEIERRHLAHMFLFKPYQEMSLLPFSLTAPDVHWISLRPSMEGMIVPSKFYGVAAAGRATIAVSDPDGEIGRLVSVHHCGAVVAPGDATRLTELILALKNDPDRLNAMGRNARDMLETQYRKEHALKRWERLLDTVSRS